MKESLMFNAVDVTAGQTSTPLALGDLTTYSIHVEFSDNSISGDLKLQVKNVDAGTWIDLPGSTQAVAAGVAHMWNTEGAGYELVRAVWTYTAGAGTMSAFGIIKENQIKGA